MSIYTPNIGSQQQVRQILIDIKVEIYSNTSGEL